MEQGSVSTNEKIATGKERLAKIAVFASGQGSTLRNLQQKIEQGELRHVEIALVISNNSGSGALQFARECHLPHSHLSLLKVGGEEEALGAAMLEELRKAKVELIVLAGYMRKLPLAVTAAFSNRIVNVHPALLPAFGGAGMYGLNVHQAVLERGCKVSGATVHLVTEEYDAGPIVLQECCTVQENDTPEQLQARVQEIESRLLPQAVELLASGRVITEGNRARVV